jgi:DNA (cytosine-5)-methyltransferase 1
LDLGFQDAGFDILLSFDKARAAIRTHKMNFPKGTPIEADLTKLGPQGICHALRQRLSPGTQIGVIGGPPCQGFSRANTGSHTTDPRNSLVDLYIACVKELASAFRVDFVVFENVMGIRDKKHRATFDRLIVSLREIGLFVSWNECCAIDFGVPQLRRRIIVIGLARCGDTPLRILKREGHRSVRDAIAHLGKPIFYRPGLGPADVPVHPNHWTSRPRSLRFTTPLKKWKPTRSFKRTFWSRPSPTIAFGHREIHVHPNGKRRLSIYEAMLLQGFPADFVLAGNLTEQVEQISNAVPPPLALSVACAIKSLLGEGAPAPGRQLP